MIQLQITDIYLRRPETEQCEYKLFLQMMVNRISVGFLRYGRARKSQKYLTRMKKELAAYERTGNAEQLINIANYCALEMITPENKKFHFDATVESIVRGKE